MTNKKINTFAPLDIQEVVFTNGTTLKNVTAWLAGDFLIVSMEDRPNMYNIRTIAELRGVQEIRPNTNGNVWFM